MKICVQGLWHLGSVTSACLASLGHEVVGLDSDKKTIQELQLGKAPLYEPGLDALITQGLKDKNLQFTSSPALALANASVLWVTFDTPVDEEDRADVEFVLTQIKTSLPHLPEKSVVLISSQMPVGSVRGLEKFALNNYADKEISFAYSPENLRLGKALDVFLNPDRIIVGFRDSYTKTILEKLLLTISSKIEWMSIESAEMTKHAINAFLATSVTFINEIAAICELVGADAKEVERGLKTESRIGPKAYLSPGGAFAGGTLARDIQFLGQISETGKLPTPLLSSVRISNDVHKGWAKRKLQESFVSLDGVIVGIWGLTYKPGTNTLRRSMSVELCEWLLEQGASLKVFDPAVKLLPSHLNNMIDICSSALEVLEDAKVLIVGTEWPEFREIALSISKDIPNSLIVIDANRHLQQALADSSITYLSVGSTKKSK
jgi:UDPglucose 6-dehydrogenase